MMRSLVVGSLLLALTACGDDGPSPMQAKDLCAAYVDAFCGGLEACCNTGREAECRAVELQYCVNEVLTEDDRGIAPSGPNVPARIVFDFDEEAAGAALARIESVFSRCQGSPSMPLMTFADTHVLGEPGAECLAQRDCIEGTRCEHPPLAVFGTCVIAPFEGEACVDRCASPQLACVDDRGDAICVAARGEGESCLTVPCSDGLVCVSTSSVVGGGGARSCQPPLSTGASCAYDFDCESRVCLGGRCQAASARETFCAMF